jgi:hypothetical protein
MIRKSGTTKVRIGKTIFFLSILLSTFTGAFAQEMQEEQPASGGLSPREETTAPAQNQITIGGDLWGNQPSGGSTSDPSTQREGERDEVNGGNNESTGANIGSTGRGGIRRTTTSGGITRENGTNPAGNPDVPFDQNMNIVFLLSGLIFAFFIARRKFILKRES